MMEGTGISDSQRNRHRSRSVLHFAISYASSAAGRKLERPPPAVQPAKWREHVGSGSSRSSAVAGEGGWAKSAAHGARGNARTGRDVAGRVAELKDDGFIGPAERILSAGCRDRLLARRDARAGMCLSRTASLTSALELAEGGSRPTESMTGLNAVG